ncbi:MAG TPA: hypothetical protein VG797_03210 [Phycisphaerales bacterium]|nr:hypothetical protein [Phycisphaerales bacterium]
MTRVIAALSVVLACTGPLFAGPLTPPAGPVAPTTGPEPRVAINAANTPGDADATPSMFKITQPGSYYLTGNITGTSGKAGIEVASSDVTWLRAPRRPWVWRRMARLGSTFHGFRRP